MRLIKFAFVALSVLFLAIACNNPNSTNQTANTPTQPTPDAAPAPTTDELAAARTLYGLACATCHGQQGEGGEFGEGRRRRRAPGLREGHARDHTDEQLARQISNGGDGMPAFGTRLRPEQINELVRLIRRDFQSGSGAPTNAASPSGARD